MNVSEMFRRPRSQKSAAVHVGRITACHLLVWCCIGSRAVLADDETVRLHPNWKKGDRTAYEVTKSIKRQTARSTAIDMTMRFDLDLHLKDARDDGFTIGWKLSNSRDSRPSGGPNLTFDTLTQAMAGVEIAVDIGRKGSPMKLREWENPRKEIRANLDRYLKVATELESRPETTGSSKKLRSNADRIKRELAGFDTKEQVEGFLLKQPVLFFLLIGMEHTKGKKFEYKGAEPNLYGGEPIPCHGSIELKSFDISTATAKLIWTQSLDAEKGARILEKTSKDLREKAGTKPTKGSPPRLLEINDDAEFDMDALTGWPKRISHTRTAKADEITHRETIEMRRK